MRKKVFLVTNVVLLCILLGVIFNTYTDKISDMFNYSKTAISYYGSRGQEVIDIQTKLYKWGYYKGIVDGVYGYKTYLAVKSFQSKNGLKADGVAGDSTLAALGLATSRSYSTSSYSKDINLLAHIIHGEARGEPYEGQVAVGAVILNRVRNSKFPNTIAGVIYQPGAFDAVKDGQINLQPSTTSYRCARDAYNGWDPAKGAIYYFNPNTATSSWIWTRPVVRVIGNHYFAR